MSCGVALERLQINETDMLLTSTTLKDKGSDVEELNTSQQACEINELELQATCSNFEQDIRETHVKQGQKIKRDVYSMDCTSDGDCNTSSTANLRLTLKKVKLETGDKEEDTCLYVCHTKKPNASRKLLVKCADRSSNTITNRATKDSYGLTDPGKVMC